MEIGQVIFFNSSLQPIIMRNCMTLILFIISIFCTAKTEIKAEKIDVNGIVLFRFIPETKMQDFYCSLKPRILIDSITYDFIPTNYTNYSIIRANSQIEKTFGVADSFPTGNLETNFCVLWPNDKRLANYNCDSVLKVYYENNIYDSILYNPDSEEHMTMRIKSKAIYTKEFSDTIYIAIQFKGTVIKYDNIVFGAQSDYRTTSFDDGTEEFDDSHGICPFEKFDSTIIVLNKATRLDRIDKEKQIQLQLIKSELTHLKMFLHE